MTLDATTVALRTEAHCADTWAIVTQDKEVRAKAK